MRILRTITTSASRSTKSPTTATMLTSAQPGNHFLTKSTRSPRNQAPNRPHTKQSSPRSATWHNDSRAPKQRSLQATSDRSPQLASRPLHPSRLPARSNPSSPQRDVVQHNPSFHRIPQIHPRWPYDIRNGALVQGVHKHKQPALRQRVQRRLH